MTFQRSLVRRSALVAGMAAAAVVLAACGGDSDSNSKMSGHDMGSTKSSAPASASASARAGAHNSADVKFAQDMIQHHRQAVEMAGLAEVRASSSDVKALAEKIKEAQEPEIKTFSGWLTGWGEKVPEDMTGMGHDMAYGMPGMMSSAAMDKLEKASGTEFDTMFMEMMTKHHQGAITMARTEKKQGEYGPAKELADSIIIAQSAEIQQMDKLLGKS